jgi:hypothetical protein
VSTAHGRNQTNLEPTFTEKTHLLVAKRLGNSKNLPFSCPNLKTNFDYPYRGLAFQTRPEPERRFGRYLGGELKMEEFRPPTDAELEAIERRILDATPGPWLAQIFASLERAKMFDRFRWAQPHPRTGVWPLSPKGEVGVVLRVLPNRSRKKEDTAIRVGLPGLVEVSGADAHFIANARTDLPVLLLEVRRLRDLLAQHRIVPVSI